MCPPIYRRLHQIWTHLQKNEMVPEILEMDKSERNERLSPHRISLLQLQRRRNQIVI